MTGRDKASRFVREVGDYARMNGVTASEHEDQNPRGQHLKKSEAVAAQESTDTLGPRNYGKAAHTLLVGERFHGRQCPCSIRGQAARIAGSRDFICSRDNLISANASWCDCGRFMRDS